MTRTTIQSSISNVSFDKTDTKVAKRYIYIGYFIIFLFFISIVAWAVIAPISSAAIAPGLVSKDGYRKTVQHLEGGIIHKIFVKDGSKVNVGEKLIELDNIQSRADYDLMRKQKLIALAKEAGLLAESRDENEVTLPRSINLETVDAPVRNAIQGQIDAFFVRRNIHTTQLEIIGQRIQQANRKITALKNEMQALKNKGLIIDQELKEYQHFEERGLVTRTQVFTLKRDQASNKTDKTTNQVSVESIHQEINNLKMEKSELIATYSNRFVSNLDSVRNQLIDLNEKLAKTEDRLDRTIIRAPIEGVIVDLRVNTIGGVVQPGEALLDIVPAEGKLVVEARIDPKDRDTVNVGQEAEVRFVAFNQRITTPVKGKVVLISADRLVDEAAGGTQSAYYKAKVELLEDPSEIMNGAPVYPGMQADVMIITGKRTAMDYFLKPIIKSFNRAFRDD